MGEPLAMLPPTRARGAHLLGAEAAQQFADVRVDGRKIGLDLGIGGAGTDGEFVAVVLDAVEIGHLADMDDARQVAQLLGDPQADIGAAGHDGGVRVKLVELGEAVDAARRGEEAAFVADEDILAVGEEGEHALHVVAAGAEAVVAPAFAGRHRGVDDRPVAGAAAEIAGDPVIDLVARHLAFGRLVHGEQRHDEARRAEAALRGVACDHLLLDRMQRAVRRGEVLDRHHLAAVDLTEKLDAGIDRLVDQPAAAHAAERHRAGAAIALGAAFLGAGGAFGFAQIVEQQRIGIDVGELDQTALADEADRRTHQLPRYVE